MTGSKVPTDTISLVSGLELQVTSTNEVSSPAAANDADLRYVGVAAVHGATTAFNDTKVLFGIATYGKWSTPTDVEFDFYIDADNDGTDDYVVYNAPLITSAGDATDVFVANFYDLNTQSVLSQELLNGIAPVSSIPTSTIPASCCCQSV